MILGSELLAGSGELDEVEDVAGDIGEGDTDVGGEIEEDKDADVEEEVGAEVEGDEGDAETLEGDVEPEVEGEGGLGEGETSGAIVGDEVVVVVEGGREGKEGEETAGVVGGDEEGGEAFVELVEFKAAVSAAVSAAVATVVGF